MGAQAYGESASGCGGVPGEREWVRDAQLESEAAARYVFDAPVICGFAPVDADITSGDVGRADPVELFGQATRDMVALPRPVAAAAAADGCGASAAYASEPSPFEGGYASTRTRRGCQQIYNDGRLDPSIILYDPLTTARVKASTPFGWSMGANTIEQARAAVAAADAARAAA